MSRVLRILEYKGREEDIRRTLSKSAVPIMSKRNFGNISISSNIVKLEDEDSDRDYNGETKSEFKKRVQKAPKKITVKTLKELVSLPTYKTTSSIGLEFEEDSGLKSCIFLPEIKFCGSEVTLQKIKNKYYDYVGVNKMGSIHLRKEWINNIGGIDVR